MRAVLVVKRRDGDAAKENRLRGLLVAKRMIRRDTNGAVVVDLLLQGGKGRGR